MSFKTFITSNKRLLAILLLVALSIGLNVYFYNLVQEKNREIAVKDNNIFALTDTITVAKNKVGQLEYEKRSFLVPKLSELSKLNDSLAQEVKNEKGTVNTIIKSQVVVKHDTITLVTTPEVNDSTVRVNFTYDKTYSEGNFRKTSGFTLYNLKNKSSYGTLTTDEFGLKLITGIKNLDKGTPTIFVRSDYPGFSVTSIEGAVLDKNLFRKKQPLITLSANIGWVPFTYDLGKKQSEFNFNRVGLSIGAGVNLLELIKRK